jgi:HPt (histidine-containing phosphotransfer) domain-containing protein
MMGHVAKPFTQEALMAALAGNSTGVGAGTLEGAEAAQHVRFAAVPVMDMKIFETTSGFLPPGKLASYLETLSDSIEHVRQALPAWTLSETDLLDDVHKIAGSAAMVGLVRLGDVARAFEGAARANAPEAMTLAAYFGTTMAASRQELQDRCKDLRTAKAVPEQSSARALELHGEIASDR